MSNNYNFRFCPLCGSAASKIFMSASNWKNLYKVAVLKCQKCGFLYSSEDKYNYIDLFPAKFLNSDISNLLEMARQDGLDSLAIDLLRTSKLKLDARILDFGAGIGLTALILMQLGYKVSTVEASKKFLDKSSALGINAFSSLDLARSASPEGFDLVIVKDVLEHVSHPREMFKDLVASVKPNGYLYIRVPNANAYWCHWSIDTMGHINHFTPRFLFNLARDAGLKKVNFIGVFDIRTSVGRIYNSIFWKLRFVFPLYHQISVIFKKI